MKIKLHTETVIDSCHSLREYDGPCLRRHGHSWFIEVWIEGDEKYQDSVGILFDFGNVKKIKDKYDHYDINTIEPFTEINPTAENLCKQFYKELKQIKPELDYKVRVYETYVGKKTWSETGDF